MKQLSTATPVIIFASLGHAFFHIIVALFLTLVLVLQPIWAVPYNDLISLWTAGAFLLGLGAPLSGWLADKLGETRLMIVYFLGIGLSCMACGFSNGPHALMVALALVGLFGSIYHPVGTTWVVKNVERRGRSIAIVGIAGSFGVALASIVAGVLSDVWDCALAHCVYCSRGRCYAHRDCASGGLPARCRR